MGEAFLKAVDELDAAAARGTSLGRPFVDLLRPVDGAAISTIGGFLGAGTVEATDLRAARLDELQLDLGEGPCWDAVVTGLPVQISDLRRPGTDRWASFIDRVGAEGIAAVFAFPLSVGRLRVGAIDLYSFERGGLDDDEVRDTSALADLAARHVVRRIVRDLGTEVPDIDASTRSRAVVHQATGMVLAQLGVSADDALLVLRGRAYSSGLSVREISVEVVERRLDFAAESRGPRT